jgi:hypothetical protein
MKGHNKELPPINQRIRDLVIKFSNGNVSEFVKLINLNKHQNFNRIFNIDKRNEKYPTPSSEILNYIKINLPTVNYDWLITGKGNMLLNDVEHEGNNVKERIKDFIAYKKISIREFERTCGLSNGYINGITQTIMPNKLSGINLCFPELNTAWLLTGEGQMLKNTIQQNDMDTKNRLLKFLNYLGIGQNAFEKEAGIANGYISHNKGSIGSLIINKISNRYPELNINWLLTGQGEMLNEQQKNFAVSDNTTDIPPVNDFVCLHREALQQIIDTNAKLVERILELTSIYAKKTDIAGDVRGTHAANQM